MLCVILSPPETTGIVSTPLLSPNPSMVRDPTKPLKVALNDPRIPHLVSCPALKIREPAYDYTTPILERLRIKPGVTAVCTFLSSAYLGYQPADTIHRLHLPLQTTPTAS